MLCAPELKDFYLFFPQFGNDSINMSQLNENFYLIVKCSWKVFRTYHVQHITSCVEDVRCIKERIKKIIVELKKNSILSSKQNWIWKFLPGRKISQKKKKTTLQILLPFELSWHLVHVLRQMNSGIWPTHHVGVVP